VRDTYIFKPKNEFYSNCRDKLPNYYNELMLNNEELMTSFKIRSENFSEVQRLLSEINKILYKAQRLRGKIFNLIILT
jgi:hypothetical protein